MTEKSRTEYSAKNTSVAIVARVIAILMGFATRVVFTHSLNEDYVGINGLFTDILNVLALSELGVGTAVSYALYKPVADKDTEKQKALMLLYKKFYQAVAGIVLVVGLLIIPFMGILIKNQPKVDHLILIYCLYLINSVLSYLFIYKKTLIDAHQQNYIGVIYQTAFLVLQDVLQILILIFSSDFVLFVMVMILCTIGNNICVSRKADKMFPYLREKKIDAISVEEKNGIFKNIKAMFMHKIGNVVVNNTDNLLLSSMVGTLAVACYTNYFLIIGSVRQILVQVFQGITASVGNMGVSESKERIRRVYEASFFIGQWMYGLAAICLYEILDTFVGFSFGESYVFDNHITLILCISFYITGMRQATLVFRDSLGLFWYDRYKAIAEALINLVGSLILAYYFKTAGVFLGTILSTVTTSTWVEPYMLYKHRLKESCVMYFVKYGIYASVTAGLWWVCHQACAVVTGTGLLACIEKGIICAVIINLVYLILYCKTDEFKLVFNKGKKLLFKSKTVDNPVQFSEAETALLALVKDGLVEQNTSAAFLNEETDYEEISRIAQNHSVLSLVFPVIENNREIPVEFRKNTARYAQVRVEKNYRLLYATNDILKALAAENIQVVLLKGITTANYYPYPELRKAGDIDLLLMDTSAMDRACEILENLGYIKEEEQHAWHHVAFSFGEHVEVELHCFPVEKFDNKRVNACIKEQLKRGEFTIVKQKILGFDLPVLSDAAHGYELLLHMLQHFLRAGFGLKLLCDWVVFWNRDIEKAEQEKYLRLIRESKIKGFSDMITLLCQKRLGLDSEKTKWMELEDYPVDEMLLEIFEAEEFGKSSGERMVALRSTKKIDYIREFHHQMRLNFPKMSTVFLLWPVLWCVTLVRFIVNNKKIRNVSAKEVFQNAQKRGKIVERIHLFR